MPGAKSDRLKGNSKPSVRVKILDTEYSVTGYEDADYLQQVASYVDRQMRLLREQEADIPLQKVAVLAALNLADELMRARAQLEQQQEEASSFSREVAERSRKLAEQCTRD